MKNTMAMKLICMLLCVVMLGAMLAGCASGKQETAQTQPAAADPAATSTPAAETDAPATEESPLTGTISIMSTKDSWYPGFDDVCEQIEKNYGIAVDLTLVDDSSMGEILGVKFSTGDAPDIFLQNAPQVVEQYDAPNNCVVLDNEPWVSRCTDADYLRYKGDGRRSISRPASSAACITTRRSWLTAASPTRTRRLIRSSLTSARPSRITAIHLSG